MTVSIRSDVFRRSMVTHRFGEPRTRPHTEHQDSADRLYRATHGSLILLEGGPEMEYRAVVLEDLVSW